MIFKMKVFTGSATHTIRSIDMPLILFVKFRNVLRYSVMLSWVVKSLMSSFVCEVSRIIEVHSSEFNRYQNESKVF